jgi:hypothetical protein
MQGMPTQRCPDRSKPRRSLRSAAADVRVDLSRWIGQRIGRHLATFLPMRWRSCIGFSAALIDVSDGIKDEGVGPQEVGPQDEIAR